MKLRNVHVKVKWAAVVGALWTAAVAIAAACGLEVPAPAVSALGTILAALAGYAAPTHGEPQDQS